MKRSWLRPWLRLRRTRPGHARRAPGQHPLPVRPQRVDVHVLRRFGRLVALRLAAARLPHPLPIRRLVAGPPVPLRVHIRFDQRRPVAMLALPVPGQLPQRQPQRMRGQILYLHPGEQQESRVPHHQPQVLAVRLALPADAPVPAGQVAGREVEQQAAQQAPLAVAQEIAQVRAEWLAVAEVVVALDPLVPLRDRFRALGQFQPQRPQRSQRLRNRRLGVRAGRSPDGPLRAAPAVPLGWQGEDLSCSRVSSTRRASWTLLLPLGACQPRCSQMVWPSSARLSWGKRPTVSWMSAIWRRVRRLPRKVVDFRFRMRGSMAGLGVIRN